MITMSRLGRDGQLGNQLFQYAMLRAVATRRGFELRIPKTYDGVKKQNRVELDRFYIEVSALPPEQKFSHIFQDGAGAFNPAVFEQPDGTDYRGWYQSEKYFADIAPQIRREFRFHWDIDQTVTTFIDELRADTDRKLLSLHVRRGDYVQHANKFRVLGLSYYQSAFKSIVDQGALEADHEPFVLVFSDDIPWCRSNLKLHGNPVLVFVEMVDHWHDLCAMSKCDHHIIAASSFGWWGAWLNPSPDKRVIAPKPWFNSGLVVGNPPQPYDTRDMVPADWQQLETRENYS